MRRRSVLYFIFASRIYLCVSEWHNGATWKIGVATWLPYCWFLGYRPKKRNPEKIWWSFFCLNPSLLLQTCGENHLLGDKFIIYDGELRKLNLRHPCDCIIITTPVKLNVVSCVSICKRKHTWVHKTVKNTAFSETLCSKWPLYLSEPAIIVWYVNSNLSIFKSTETLQSHTTS